MLTQHQAVAAVQLHIEGVAAGIAHFVGVHIVVAIAVSLGGVLVVHQGDAAVPDAVVGTGRNPNPVAHIQAAPLQLADGALDPVGAGLLDGDVGQGIAVIIGAVFVDGSDTASDGGSDGSTFL